MTSTHRQHPGSTDRTGSSGSSGSGGSGSTGEEIVLLHPDGTAAGTAPKRASHHSDTPLHLAFSCYLIDERERVLITRRAHHKATWPSVWTNACCGHPAPGEGVRTAVRRRIRQELGIGVDRLTLILPDFGYRAVMGNGVVEHELCPVVRGVAVGGLAPDPEEVADAEWRSWEDCVALADDPAASPWFKEQMRRLVPMGVPSDWRQGSAESLPPAAAW